MQKGRVRAIYREPERSIANTTMVLCTVSLVSRVVQSSAPASREMCAGIPSAAEWSNRSRQRATIGSVSGTPPYGGAFPDIVPHVTVAAGIHEEQLREIEADILSQLPIKTHLNHACL